MRPEIMDGIRAHITAFCGTDTIDIIEISPGHTRLFVKVPDMAINIYGGLHGGYLYTLCDTAAGMTAYSHEVTNVTQNGNITYLRGTSSRTLYVEANTIHKGRRTAVIQADITDELGRLLVTSTFSMFLTGTI